MPKSKIRVKRNERIKMTFTVDECEGSLRGRRGGQVNRGRNWRGAGRGWTAAMQRKTQGHSTRNIKYSARCSYLAPVSKSSIGLYRQRNHM